MITRMQVLPIKNLERWAKKSVGHGVLIYWYGTRSAQRIGSKPIVGIRHSADSEHSVCLRQAVPWFVILSGLSAAQAFAVRSQSVWVKFFKRRGKEEGLYYSKCKLVHRLSTFQLAFSCSTRIPLYLGRERTWVLLAERHLYRLLCGTAAFTFVILRHSLCFREGCPFNE